MKKSLQIFIQMVSAQGSTDMQEFFAFLALLMFIFPKRNKKNIFYCSDS